MAQNGYVTTRHRRILSVFLGAAIGGGVTALPSIVLFAERGALATMDVIGGMIASFIGWLLGILALGLPVWWLVERMGWGPGRRAALLCGASLPPLWFFLFLLLVKNASPRPDQNASSMISIVEAIIAVPVALLGMGVAWAMWRFAYRRAATPDIAATFS